MWKKYITCLWPSISTLNPTTLVKIRQSAKKVDARQRERIPQYLGLVAPRLVGDCVIPHSDHRIPTLQLRLTGAHPQAAHQLPQIVLRHKALYPALPTGKIKHTRIENHAKGKGETGI